MIAIQEQEQSIAQPFTRQCGQMKIIQEAETTWPGSSDTFCSFGSSLADTWNGSTKEIKNIQHYSQEELVKMHSQSQPVKQYNTADKHGLSGPTI